MFNVLDMGNSHHFYHSSWEGHKVSVAKLVGGFIEVFHVLKALQIRICKQ
jgi:hypothetical protein